MPRSISSATTRRRSRSKLAGQWTKLSKRCGKSTASSASGTRLLEDGWHDFELRTPSDRDPREAIYKRFAHQDGWSLRRLDLRRRKLEDLFVEVVLRGEEQPRVA